jgi:hypothetical protein
VLRAQRQRDRRQGRRQLTRPAPCGLATLRSAHRPRDVGCAGWLAAVAGWLAAACGRHACRSRSRGRPGQSPSPGMWHATCMCAPAWGPSLVAVVVARSAAGVGWGGGGKHDSGTICVAASWHGAADVVPLTGAC